LNYSYEKNKVEFPDEFYEYVLRKDDSWIDWNIKEIPNKE